MRIPMKTNKKASEDIWELRLYIAGQSPKSLTAFANLKQLCEEYLPGRYTIEVIDLVLHHHGAEALPNELERGASGVQCLNLDLSGAAHQPA